MLFRREFLLKHQVEYALTRHEDVIFLQKALYLAKDIQCINSPMFLYRNNPYSETHRSQSPDTLYVPLLQSWMLLLQWFESNYSTDLEIINSTKNMICVYALEGIEAMYQYGMTDMEVTRIVEEQYPTNVLCEYQSIMYADFRKELFQEYLNNRSAFLRREKLQRIKWFFLYTIRKIPGVKWAYQKVKYPELIQKKIYCYQ